MGVEYLKANFTAGELDPRLHARTDIEKFTSGVKDATNMTILPYGGLKRRQGLSKITDSKVSTTARLVAFVFNITQSYLIVLKPLSIDILKDGVIQSTEVTPFLESELYEIDIIQSADTMIFAHEAHPPQQLQRQGSDVDWEFKAITFDYAPKESDGTTPAWDATKGYPRTCTFFGGRLWFAGTTEHPTTIWGSRVNGFFNFDLGDGSDDLALSDILDSDQYNIIQTIFPGRQLQVFTSGGEIKNTADFITPTTSSWQRQTGYGSKKIRPVLIDGATLFVDNSGRTIRQFIYDYNEDGNVSINASLLSSHLITEVKAVDAITGTLLDVGDYVYVVNADGTVAVLNTMRSEKITGWTHWETEGTFEDVCVVGKDVYFLVKRNEVLFIEKLTDNTYTDHNVVKDGVEPTTYDVIAGTDNVLMGADNVIYTDISSGTLVTELQTDFDAAFMDTEFKVIADFSVMPEQKPTGVADDNVITVDRGAYRIEAGLNFTTKVTTLPLATDTQKGTTLHRRKRVIKVDINIVDTLGVYARNRFTNDRQFTVVLDKAPTPYTGFKEMYLLGYDRLAEIEISQKEPLPFTLRALGFEVEY